MRANESDGTYNRIIETSSTLAKTEDSLKARRRSGKRDAQISELEAQNNNWMPKAADLNNSITNLQSQIDDTQKKLATSEATRRFWEELNGSWLKKPNLTQFNDLKSAHASRQAQGGIEHLAPVAWIREAFSPARNKSGELLMQKSMSAPVPRQRRSPKPGSYDSQRGSQRRRFGCESLRQPNGARPIRCPNDPRPCAR